jgi:hypothetical protein
VIAKVRTVVREEVRAEIRTEVRPDRREKVSADAIAEAE